MRLYYGGSAAANVTFTINGTTQTYGPAVLNIPAGADGLTIDFDTPFRLDAASVFYGEPGGRRGDGSDIFLTLYSNRPTHRPTFPGGAPCG